MITTKYVSTYINSIIQLDVKQVSKFVYMLGCMIEVGDY